VTYAKVIADSVSAIDNVRLTTFEVRTRRFMLPEFNTHRTLSRNSASSRAIPFHKQLAKIEEDLAYPEVFPLEQKGMQGGDALTGASLMDAKDVWVEASQEAVKKAQKLAKLNVHKSVVNRILEPFMWHTIVVTATAWENFFLQRCSPLAQPEIRLLAEMMRQAHGESEPVIMGRGEWHLPYVDPQDWEAISVAAKSMQSPMLDNEMAQMGAQVSAARCARVSYLTQDGKRDIQADLDLYERLVTARPAHWSPLEHVATPWSENRQAWDMGFAFTSFDGRSHSPATEHLPKVGNLLGWRSLRTTIEAELGEVTYR
jgi:thymidylate synthase ThyX